jgi:hypothetical protein
MRRNSLSQKGLSLSTAQSISNLCNQRSKEITSKLEQTNNFSRTINIGGETYTETQAFQLPENVVSLLQEKSRLHATQAFLMENIKSKDELVKSIQKEQFNYLVVQPKRGEVEIPKLLSLIDEEWGWSQLSLNEYNEFLEAEAYASHIGQYIHKGGKLDRLRSELPNIKTLEFFEVEVGKKTPVKVDIHHTSEQLVNLHEELAALHRDYEKKVNYFKSKVKNSVTTENARIAKENGIEQARVNEINNNINETWNKEYQAWAADYRKALQEFEADRQKRIQEAVALRIDVPSQFQGVVDKFSKQLKE